MGDPLVSIFDSLPNYEIGQTSEVRLGKTRINQMDGQVFVGPAVNIDLLQFTHRPVTEDQVQERDGREFSLGLFQFIKSKVPDLGYLAFFELE